MSGSEGQKEEAANRTLPFLVTTGRTTTAGNFIDRSGNRAIALVLLYEQEWDTASQNNKTEMKTNSGELLSPRTTQPIFPHFMRYGFCIGLKMGLPGRIRSTFRAFSERIWPESDLAFRSDGSWLGKTRAPCKTGARGAAVRVGAGVR
ncbi:MAG: hypothetical protein LBU11_04835 [Zoogloeaceae bacterium]|jgi:hypothetical protein|nr:hypothetical protein [Zoogloeaceae bacterium]